MEATSQQRAKWVERWKDSGLTAKEFAAEAGLKVSALYYWSAQLSAAARRNGHVGDDDPAPPARPSTTPVPPMIELPVVAVAPAPAMIEVLLGNVRVRVPSGVDEVTLTRVVRALVGAP
jgi:transposase